MTKTRHRTFEIFDCAEEAKGALASKSAPPLTNGDAPQSWTFRNMVASESAGIVHVKFIKTEFVSGTTLREDLTELAEALVNGSRVLLDFEGLLDFGAESIAELGNFNQKLRSKGSRFVLCNLQQEVQAAFFPARSVT